MWNLARDKLHVYRGNVSPLRGEKPIFEPLSKNNTGMAALRVGLPVKTEKHHTFSSTAGARPTIPTILGMVIEEVRAIFAPLNFIDPISSFAGTGYWKFVGKCPDRG